jgi:hypothetical protein
MPKIAPPTTADANPWAAAQFGATYGPQTQQALRRSQYIVDALKGNLEQGQKITGGWGELASRMAAQYLLHKKDDNAQDALVKAILGDQSAETERLMAPILGGLPPTVPAASSPAPAEAAAAPTPDVNLPAPTMATPTAAGKVSTDPAERRILAQMVWGEARGESPEGQRAAAAVAMNRAKSSGQRLAEVIAAPHQFSGYNDRSRALSDDQLAGVYANIDPLLSGQAPDPTGGADHFYNPRLASPSWGGPGQDIGGHRFLKLGYGGGKGGDVQMAQATPAAPPQLQIQNQFPTSAPVPSSPPAAGGPPAAPSPQAPAAGGNPFSNWPTWRPTQAQVAYVQELLSNPRTHQTGVQAAMEMRQKMTQPLEAEIQTINGVPFYVPKNPAAGAPPVMIPVPQAAMTQTVSAQQAGVSAPPGTTYSRDPLGNLKPVFQPQSGQQVVSGPSQGYREAPIPGGTQDPTAPAARFSNEGKLRDDYAKEIAPYVVAREGYQKVINAARDGSPAGDIALVFGFMKTLDPGSTVREGEQATVQNSGTIPQTVQNMYNKLVTGQGRLTPEQRAQFAQSAQNQFAVYERTFDAANKRYGDLATSYGMDPRNVVRSFDPIAPYRPAQAGGGIPAPARSAFIQLYKSGQIDERAPWGSPKRPVILSTPEQVKALDRPENRGKHFITPDGKLAVIE